MGSISSVFRIWNDEISAVPAALYGKKVRKMADVPDVARAVFIIALVVYAVLVSAAFRNIRMQPVTENRNTFSIIGLDGCVCIGGVGTDTGTEMAYAWEYSRESNAGYDRTVSRDGDFTFTVFTRTGGHDAFHPDFICFVDYDGQTGEEYSLYEYYEFENIDTAEGGGVGSAGGFIRDGFMIIGNVNESDVFRIYLSVLDSKDDGIVPGKDGSLPGVPEGALTSGSMAITI